MRILLTGARGMLGHHLREALLAQGHALVCVARAGGPQDSRCRWIEADLDAPGPIDWATALREVDAVVNLAGIFRAPSPGAFERVHHLGPVALFEACAAAGVRRVVQVSALGAAADAPTAFLRTKAAADAALLALPLDAAVLQPSLVFGPDGASTRALLVLALLPLLVLPQGGRQPVQPVHVDDVTAALVALLAAPPGRWAGQRIAAVGPAPMGLADYLLALRGQLGRAAVPVIALPGPLVALAARLGERSPRALFDRDAERMLAHGSVADAQPFAELLGRSPRAAREFIAPGEADLLRRHAAWTLLAPLLRATLAALWLWTALVSAGLYPVDASLALLERAGVPAPWRPLALYGAAALDALLGVLTVAPLAPPRRRLLWHVQALLILFYTAVITLRLPEYWLHPYGPIAKNLPLLALLGLLAAFEPRGRILGRDRDRDRDRKADREREGRPWST